MQAFQVRDGHSGTPLFFTRLIGRCKGVYENIFSKGWTHLPFLLTGGKVFVKIFSVRNGHTSLFSGLIGRWKGIIL